MIFIDWLSPADHANFNRAFLAAVGEEGDRLYVFSEKLRSDTFPTEVMADPGSRWKRAVHILRFAWRHRKERLFFLSYDPLCIPWVSFIAKRMFVFEHNTVPEGRAQAKHFIWQFLFTRGVTRCTQFPGQHVALRRLQQNTVHLGSPLPVRAGLPPTTPSQPPRPHFVVPSYRREVSGLKTLAPYIQGQTLLVKGKAIDLPIEGVQVEFAKRIEIESKRGEIRGAIILIESRIRGSGWFNDAIKLGIPVLITHPQTALLFEETFPGYPYVNVARCETPRAFEQQLAQSRDFDAPPYIAQHNDTLRERFRPLRG